MEGSGGEGEDIRRMREGTRKRKGRYKDGGRGYEKVEGKV